MELEEARSFGALVETSNRCGGGMLFLYDLF
jgi:hypothetical protein